MQEQYQHLIIFMNLNKPMFYKLFVKMKSI